jgi:hypothetical protein
MVSNAGEKFYTKISNYWGAKWSPLGLYLFKYFEKKKLLRYINQ